MASGWRINGIEVPAPTDFSWTRSDLSSDAAKRSTTGLMNKDVIARKNSVPITWNFLTWSQASKVLKACESSGAYATFNYPDPKTGGWEEMTVYTGDRTASVVFYKNEKEIYWKVSIPNIER